ncbi:MAG: acyl carrier protein [bacterium]
MEEIKKTVREYIVREVFGGDNPGDLTDATPLITGGILDSISTLKLVAFLEEQYRIEVAAHEADTENMDTIADIANLVQSKL